MVWKIGKCTIATLMLWKTIQILLIMITITQVLTQQLLTVESDMEIMPSGSTGTGFIYILVPQ